MDIFPWRDSEGCFSSQLVFFFLNQEGAACTVAGLAYWTGPLLASLLHPVAICHLFVIWRFAHREIWCACEQIGIPCSLQNQGTQVSFIARLQGNMLHDPRRPPVGLSSQQRKCVWSLSKSSYCCIASCWIRQVEGHSPWRTLPLDMPRFAMKLQASLNWGHSRNGNHRKYWHKYRWTYTTNKTKRGLPGMHYFPSISRYHEKWHV